MDAERAHDFSLKMASEFPWSANFFCDKNLLSSREYDLRLPLGPTLEWCSPVGLAAGLDKNAVAVDFFTQLNFGAVEVGTVTPLAQEGNTKPRMFRIREEKSLLNRMGFNNKGSDFLLSKLKNMKANGKLVGVNLGKNKMTPANEAHLDYQKLYEKLARFSDYLVINVSSPNTPGLRDLQKHEALREIFDSLSSLRKEQDKPLFLKLSPDINFDDIDEIIRLCEDYSLYGLIVSNTTIMPEYGQGGVSGELLKERASELRSLVLNRIKGSSLELIGVGGMSSFLDVWDYWKSGGRVFQIYSALIYQGPGLIDQILMKTVNVLKENQMKSLTELLNNIDKVKLS